MSAAAVPKPASAGNGKTAIADTKNAYVNIRNGPGTQYDDIGDIRDTTLVVYFPNTATSDGWVWAEQHGVGGWVSTSGPGFRVW